VNYLLLKGVSSFGVLTDSQCTDVLMGILGTRLFSQSIIERDACKDDFEEFYRWIEVITFEEVKANEDLSRLPDATIQPTEDKNLNNIEHSEQGDLESEAALDHQSTTQTEAGPSNPTVYPSKIPVSSLLNELDDDKNEQPRAPMLPLLNDPSNGKDNRSVAQKIDDWLKESSVPTNFLSSASKDTRGKGRADRS